MAMAGWRASFFDVDYLRLWPYFARGGAFVSNYQGSVRLLKARPLSAAGESPPVQIMVPSLI